MNYQCKNCGGNMVYSPQRGSMACPYCDGTDCEEVKGQDIPDWLNENGEGLADQSVSYEADAASIEGESQYTCISCGGQVEIGTFTSATRCPYCNNYLIVGKRIDGDFKPSLILPFKIDKDDAVSLLDREFKKRLFAPSSFLTEKTLKDMNGRYVPFFLYDMDVHSSFRGTGKKIRSWTSGDYRYTETSYYQLIREMEASYDNVPVDASIEMDDKVMDLMEPFEYSELMSFKPKFLSGFFGEVYNKPASEYEQRAEAKAKESAEKLISDTLGDYTGVVAEHKNHAISHMGIDYALMPVWVYAYNYRNKIYNFYVNGQTGKIVGKTPVSKPKLLAYGATVGALVFAGLTILSQIMGAL